MVLLEKNYLKVKNNPVVKININFMKKLNLLMILLIFLKGLEKKLNSLNNGH